MGDEVEINEEYKQIFLEESNEQLDEWEEALLTLENDPSNQAMINQAFRAIHTIKGSAGFIGFEELQRIAHDLESILQDFRDSNKPIPDNIVGILFDGMDFCKRMIDNLNNDVNEPLNIKPLLQKIESISLNKTGEGKSGEDVSGRYEKKEKNSSVLELLDESKENQKNKIVLKLETEAEKREAYLRLILVKQKISEIGTILSLEPSPESIKNIKKGTSFTFKIETDSSLEELRKSADIDQINIVSVELEESLTGVSSEKLNEKLVVGELSKEPNLQRNQEKKHTEEKVSNTYEQTNRNVAKLIKTEDIVRVPAEKLDAMLNLVGELVVHNSAFSSITDELKEKYGRTNLILNLEGKTESLSKVAWELQDAVMKVRMLPVASVFKRFFRVVRDLAKMEKKDIELEIFGEETEIDKKIIDRIGEPLVHLVRNSVDHGIEPAEVRLSLGKNKTGHIKLGAFQEGDHICIELTDDGKGLDREAIANKAIEKGLIDRSEVMQLSDKDIFNVIFTPGFSTAEKITDISGRGVGLDAVKRSIESLGGSIEIYSEKHKYTRTLIKLPLTMAIIQAILVEVGDELFAFPLSSVKEIIKEKVNRIRFVHNSMVINLRNEVIPISWLSSMLGLYNSNEEESGFTGKDKDIPIVIVDYSGSKMGVIVDRLIGREEIVIKSLSKHYREIEGLSGASIMGNGRVALILDTELLIKSYYQSCNFDELDFEVISRNEELYDENKVINHNDNELGFENNDIMEFALDISNQEGEKIDNGYLEESGDVKNFETKQDSIELENYNQGIDLIQDGELDDANKIVFEGNENSENEMEIEVLSNDPAFLDPEQQEMMDQIHSSSAINASAAMSQLMNRQVQVNFPETKLVRISDIPEELGGEENVVVGIFIGIEGSISGGMLLVIPLEYSFKLADYLYRREEGSTEEVGEEELAALGEMGNILSASFINSIGDLTKLEIKSEVPAISMDMCGSVIDSVLARFNRPGDQILLTETFLYFDENSDIICYLLLFLDEGSMKNLLEVLRREVLNEVGK